MTTKSINRREFVQSSSRLAAGIASLGPLSSFCHPTIKSTSMIKLSKVDSNFEREPLIKPYRFKGSGVSELWQSLAYLESDQGMTGIGLGTQSVLWSDSKVFFAHSENGGNALMYAMTERALQMLHGMSFSDPLEVLDQLLPEVLAYGKKITGNADLRKTFALNSLVCVDNALWLLYARQNQNN